MFKIESENKLLFHDIDNLLIDHTISDQLPKNVSGLNKEVAETIIRWKIFLIVFRHFKNPFKCLKILNKLDYLRRQVLGNNRLQKFVKFNGKYYWDLYTPGCNSKAFIKYIESEINRLQPLKSKTNEFNHVFMAITKQCVLRCEHCFEWDSLNEKDVIMSSDLRSMIIKLNNIGIGQIQFSGGEPMMRIDELTEAMKDNTENIEYWINTSGHLLTPKNAKKLKDSGITGVLISLEHYDLEQHNKFRGHPKAYQWAIQGTRNAINQGLLTAFSICVTKEFISRKNLMKFASMAKKLNVHFIQILEPKAIGHYKGKNVSLNHEQLKLLDSFYLDMNYNKKYAEFPLITYHGYHQRRVGCFASGNRSFYIDTNGDMHSCPFCHSNKGNFIGNGYLENMKRLKNSPCHSFEKATI